MKIKRLMTMMAAVAVVLGMSSCGSDDAPAEAPVAEQVAGSYTGTEVMTVNKEPDEGIKTFEFAKSTEISVDMTIPEYGEGMMSLPKMFVKNIPLTKEGNTITGKLSSYEGTVINASGAEKTYTVNDLVVVFNDKTVAVTFKLKYGNMPFSFEGQFTGVKQ